MRYALLGLILAFAGCVKAPLEGRAEPSRPPAQVYFADVDLVNRTAVDEPIMERRNGLLYVEVPIRSASNKTLYVDYRVTFLNRQGATVYQGDWEGGTTLVRNVPSRIRFNSPTPEAHDFRLDLRYSR